MTLNDIVMKLDGESSSSVSDLLDKGIETRGPVPWKLGVSHIHEVMQIILKYSRSENFTRFQLPRFNMI